jgi:hypothetical protein
MAIDYGVTAAQAAKGLGGRPRKTIVNDVALSQKINAN